jgi:coenzyme PQQ precursor peptide PqqA
MIVITVPASRHHFAGGEPMTWTTPTFDVLELGMEVGAYAGAA